MFIHLDNCDVSPAAQKLQKKLKNEKPYEYRISASILILRGGYGGFLRKYQFFFR